MDTKELLNEKVLHIRFGEGVITEIDGSRLVVSFETGKICKFSMPSCFEHFITPVNDEIKQQIKQDINIWKTVNNVYEKEKLHQQTVDRMTQIKENEKIREAERIKKAKEHSNRIRQFSFSAKPNTSDSSN